MAKYLPVAGDIFEFKDESYPPERPVLHVIVDDKGMVRVGPEGVEMFAHNGAYSSSKWKRIRRGTTAKRAAPVRKRSNGRKGG